MSRPVYFDYAATTPLDPRVRERMVACMDDSEFFGNPSSPGHRFGQRAADLVAGAAEQVATLINARPDEIVWTSGATEADNLAIIGAARYRSLHGRHIVTTAIEHKAVLAACGWLEGEGYAVTYVEPDSCGAVSPEKVAAAIRAETTLVSVMHANNETGVINDVAAIGRVCRDRDVLFHVDAAQSVGKAAVDVREQNIDLLSMNAHKACGPKGVGALYLNAERSRRIEPLLFGGGQQRGIRPGTLPVHQIVGMGESYRLLSAEMPDEPERVGELRDQLWAGISEIPGVLRNGDASDVLCSILNVSIAGVEGESLQFALRDLAVGSGSACNSASGEPSYVLRSLGRDDQLVEASVRFSLGRFSTAQDVALATETLREAVSYLRSVAPIEGG